MRWNQSVPHFHYLSFFPHCASTARVGHQLYSFLHLSLDFPPSYCLKLDGLFLLKWKRKIIPTHPISMAAGISPKYWANQTHPNFLPVLLVQPNISLHVLHRSRTWCCQPQSPQQTANDTHMHSNTPIHSPLNSSCRDPSMVHTSQGSQSTLSPAQSYSECLNDVPWEHSPPLHWVHQDLTLPGSLVLRPALADSLETSSVPTSEVHTKWGTAGNELKPQPSHIDGEFWKPQGIQAAL